MRELNNHVETSVLSEFTDDAIVQFDVVVVTENFWGTERLTQINEICRANRVGFILAETMGLASYAFLDYGPEFVVTDKDGESTKEFIVTHIERGENPVVQVHEDKRHSFEDGDFIKFAEVEGMT